MTDADKFDCWAVVEVMGHSRYAGRVSEQAIGGCDFIRVDVPAVNDRLPFTKLLGQGSIFAITPCSRQAAESVAANCYAQPMEIYSPKIQRPMIEKEDEEDYGDD
jgi:hypothetical protein